MDKIKEPNLAIMVASATALTYFEKRPNSSLEEVMQHVIRELNATSEAKIAGIAGANFVIKYKQRNPSATQKQVMQKLVESAKDIIASITDENKNMPSM